jgi:hypothetical protein
MEWLFGGAVAVVYFVPSMLARARRHGRMAGIFWLNLALGWTLIGWMLTLVWALSNPHAGAEPARPEAGT